MPELPEVETTRRGVEPPVSGACISEVVVRNARLRWPVPDDLAAVLCGGRIAGVQRRAKYLLFDIQAGGRGSGWLIVHLGMTGSLRVLPQGTLPRLHEHVDVVLDNGLLLRLRDPRRFGAVLWWPGDVALHPLLRRLGPEPLSSEFSAASWSGAVARRASAVKLALMDQAVVVGVGNIYANEALFRARIHPQRAANTLSAVEVGRLVQEVKAVLTEAIAAGGSTLRDYVGGDGAAGYFQQNYWVYGRDGEQCRACGGLVEIMRQGQRSTFLCRICQR